MVSWVGEPAVECSPLGAAGRIRLRRLIRRRLSAHSSRRVMGFPMSDTDMTLRAALPSRRCLLSLAACGALTASLPACSIPTRLAAVPPWYTSSATKVGVPNERFFPTEAAGQAGLQQEFVAAAQRQLVSRGLPP